MAKRRLGADLGALKPIRHFGIIAKLFPPFGGAYYA